MNDRYCSIEKRSRSWTNQNPKYPSQHNANVISDWRKLFGGSSTSVESLLSAREDEVSTKLKKRNLAKQILANSFIQPTDKIVSSVTHITYSCTNYGKSCATCKSFNIIYLIACSNCFKQDITKTAQQLNIRFATLGWTFLQTLN